MQQLSSLDTQFLAIESSTTYGHVSGLALLPLTKNQLHTEPFGLDRPYQQMPDLQELVESARAALDELDALVAEAAA